MLARVQICLLACACMVQSESSVQRDVPKGLEHYKPTYHGMFAPRGNENVDNIVIKQDEKGLSFQMTPRQYCDACHATIDTAIILLRRAVETRGSNSVARGTLTGSVDVTSAGKQTWNSDKMVHEVCNEGLGKYKPHLPVGCLKQFDKHRGEVMAPWLGSNSGKAGALFDNNLLITHKLNFCKLANACQPFYLNKEYQPTEENVQNTKDPCTNCLLLASDIRTTLSRLLTTMKYVPSANAQYHLHASNQMSELAMDAFVESYCSSLSMRHYKSGKLMDLCSEIIHEDDIASLGTQLRNGTFLAQQFKNETNWQHTLCVKYSNTCTQQQHHNIHMKWQESTEADYKVLEVEDSMYKSDKQYEKYKQNVRNKFVKTALVELLREYEQEHGEDYEEEHAPSLLHEPEQQKLKVEVKPADQRKKGFKQKNVPTVTPPIQPPVTEKIEVTAEMPLKLQQWEQEEIQKVEEQKKVDKYRIQWQEELEQSKNKANLLKKNRRIWTLPNEYYLSPRIEQLLHTDTEKDITQQQGKVVGELLKQQRESEQNHTNTVEVTMKTQDTHKNKEEL